MLLSREKWERMTEGYYRGGVDFGVPMAGLTGLGIGGPADVVAAPADPLSMRNLIMILTREGIPFLPMGWGTNVLVRDGGIEGVVIRFEAFTRIEVLNEDDTAAELFVEAGVPLQRLVNFCREKGYSGTEGLTGIPGTTGGAVCGNAGAYGNEMKDAVLSVVIMNAEGALDRHETADLGFGYRTSDILPSDVVLSANLRLSRDDREAVAARTDAFFARKRETQPIGEQSAGCVFKNPDGASAGRLIDEAGCKGMNVGGIEVSRVHANFFVNRGRGTAADYMQLMETVAAAVEKRFGVCLEPEIRVVGAPEARKGRG